MSRDRSLSPRINIGRPPSPPLPYSPDRDHFSSDNMLRRDRPKRSPERSVHEHLTRQEHFFGSVNNYTYILCYMQFLKVYEIVFYFYINTISIEIKKLTFICN